MTESWREPIKDIQDTVGRDKDFWESPQNLYGDSFFQIETTEEAKFDENSVKTVFKPRHTAVFAITAILLSLFTGLWLGLLISSQQGALNQSNQEVLGVRENLYQD
jgi:ABC-type dipeptide/oligopeptide/nickel transport system permease component